MTTWSALWSCSVVILDTRFWEMSYSTVWRMRGRRCGVPSLPYVWKHEITSKHSPHYWPLVTGMHWSPVYSPYKGPLMWSFSASFVVSLNKLLNKQSTCQWRDVMTLICHHCNAKQISYYDWDLSKLTVTLVVKIGSTQLSTRDGWVQQVFKMMKYHRNYQFNN